MEEDLYSKLEQKRDKVMNFLIGKTNGQPAYPSTLAEIANERIIPGTDIASFIIANPELLPMLPETVEDVIRKNLGIQTPAEKSLETAVLSQDIQKFSQFSANKGFTKPITYMNKYGTKELGKLINTLICQSDCKYNYDTMLKIRESIMAYCIENLFSEAIGFNPQLKTDVGYFDKQPYDYEQDSSPKIRVHLEKKFLTSINYLFEIDSMPIIGDIFFEEPGAKRIQRELNEKSLKKKQFAITHLYDGKIPGMLIIIPQDAINENNDFTKHLDRYMELNGKLICLPFSYGEIYKRVVNQKELNNAPKA